MKNKKTIKDILEEKINQENIYKKIISKKIKNNNFKKLIFIPACLIFIFCIFTISPKFEKNVNYENNLYQIEINEFGYTNSVHSDTNFNYSMDIEYRIDDIKESIILPFKNFNLPTDLEEIKNQILYKQNNVFGYRKVYISKYNKNRYISVTLLNDGFKREDSKISIINNIEYIIYRSSAGFIVQFEYDKEYIEIEVSNISEDELINLLSLFRMEK